MKVVLAVVGEIAELNVVLHVVLLAKKRVALVIVVVALVAQEKLCRGVHAQATALAVAVVDVVALVVMAVPVLVRLLVVVAVDHLVQEHVEAALEPVDLDVQVSA